MKRILYCLPLLLLLFSCNTVKPLTEEEREMIVSATPFKTEEIIRTEYETIEVPVYVYPETGEILSLPKARASANAVEESIEKNLVSVQSTSDFRNGIAEYSFLDGKIYEVFCSPDNVTDIRLAPGESISGDAAIGDSESWQLSTAFSNENGAQVVHIYVKPVVSGLETSMVIPTNLRTYYLRLSSYDNLHMLAVRWKYPSLTTFRLANSEQNAIANYESTSTTLLINPASLYSKYRIKGKSSIWKPVSVYDDGVHTYFQFDPRFETSSGAPALYLLPSKWAGDKKVEIVNYIAKGSLYIADFVLQDKQCWYLMNESVRIKVTRK